LGRLATIAAMEAVLGAVVAVFIETAAAASTAATKTSTLAGWCVAIAWFGAGCRN
jgi:hypothetical protein